MWNLMGRLPLTGQILWFFQGQRGPRRREEGLKITCPLEGGTSWHYHRREALRIVEHTLKRNSVSWISPDKGEWLVDLDELKRSVAGLNFMPEYRLDHREAITTLGGADWLQGKALIMPEVENEERVAYRGSQYERVKYTTNVRLYITPEDARRVIVASETPVEIRESLERFVEDHPDPDRAAFVMMRYGETRAHREITAAVKDGLAAHGIAGLRADDKRYHNDLYYNILTYMHGCGHGVAVFERIEQESFNPNVALEVGYMLALRKEVCLLKDKTLPTLHGDLVGRLYDPFDPQDAAGTIPDKLSKWLSDKGLVFNGGV